jgi:4-methylaminobutanoate oxidase (formaldehyde-forming)
MDLTKMDVRRFGPQYRSRRYSLARAVEIYSTHYDVRYPGEESHAGRPLKMSPTYGRLDLLGAEFGEKSGWERANWFRTNEDAAYEDRRPRGWAGENWSTAIVVEHLATRERGGLFDETSFAKIEVTGERAVAFLQRVCAGNVDRPLGSIVYTQMLNRRGGIQADVTVTRLGEERFRIVTGTGSGTHDLAWLRTRLRDQPGGVEIRDVTSSLACIGLWGPRARDVLAGVSGDDLSDEAFPYLTARDIMVADVPCFAARVTYVGELGWELYPATEYGATLWDVLLQAGTEHVLAPAGYRAIDSLRLEKGYRAWGSDITPDDTPFDAGLGFAVAFDKDTDFVGRSALERLRDAGPPPRRLVTLFLDDPRAVALGNEPVFVDDRVVSRITSGGIGYSVGRSIAHAYLPTDLSAAGTRVEVSVFGERVGAVVAPGAPYDPKGERIRA